MHGNIRVSRWMPFTAQQVLAPEGFIWAADAGRFPMRIRGFDRFCDGTGEMRWKVARVLPVMASADDDTARSAAGRLAGETMLLPSGALGGNVSWHGGDHQGDDDDDDGDDHHATATVVTGSFTHDVTVRIDDDGRLSTVTLPRWGNPDHAPHSEHLFGVEMSGERSVDGCLLPTALRAGWWYGSDRWAHGEFYRAEIDRAELF